MKKDVLTPEAPDLTAEACAWLAQLESGALSKEDLAAFREWIKRSPRHYAEIRRLARLSLETNVLAEIAGPLKEVSKRRKPLLRQRNVSRFVSEFISGPGSSQISSSGRLKQWSLAAAATLAVALFAAAILFAPDSRGRREPYLVATAVGETGEVALADGSQVKLNTASQIEVDLGGSQRRIRLLTGEAFFEVAHDRTRPFTVYVGDKHVTAVGTSFAVRWTGNDLVVTVSEGRVAFGAAAAAEADGAERPPVRGSSAPARPTTKTTLLAGQRLAVSGASSGEVVEEVTARELSRELAWRSGLLDFDNAPLRDVVLEMQRYTTLDIEIADDALSDLKLGGVFRIGETEAFFEALELSFGVKVVRVDEGRVLLQSAG